MGSDRALARSVGRHVNRFLHVEAASGLLLLAAALAAMVWANSPWSEAYTDLWASDIGVTVAGHSLVLDLRHWLNDGLMTLFFFVLGLEIKQELIDGQLNSARSAAIPAIGALGGMVVPAAVYAALNAGGDGAGGWGIPWPPTWPSRSAYSPCSAAACRRRSRCYCSPWRSSTTSAPSS